MELRTHDLISYFREILCREIDLELDFGNDTSSKKIEYFLEHGKSCLIKYLIKLDRDMVRNLCGDFLGYKEGSFAALCQGLCSLFFRKKGSDLNARRNEHQNLLEFSDEDNNMSLEIFGRIIPNEIVTQILAFCGFSTRVGCVCKLFYITLLTNFRSVNISPKNIYKISLIILRNVRKVKIDFVFRSFCPLRFFQVNYLFEQLQNVKILHLDTSDIFRTKQVIEMFQQRKKSSMLSQNNENKVFYPFNNVTKLIFSEVSKYERSTCHKLNRYDQTPIVGKCIPKSFWEGYCLEYLFPICKELVLPPKGIFSLEDCKSLETLNIELLSGDLRSFSNNNLNFSNLPETNLGSFLMKCRFMLSDIKIDEKSVKNTISKIIKRCRDIRKISISSKGGITRKRLLKLKKGLRKSYFVGSCREEFGGEVKVFGKKEWLPRYEMLFLSRNSLKLYVLYVVWDKAQKCFEEDE